MPQQHNKYDIIEKNPLLEMLSLQMPEILQQQTVEKNKDILKDDL
jgi:hypothetical protein